MYCYHPNDRVKREMADGILNTHPDMVLECERPELNPHYEATKRNFRNTITFCSMCSSGSCACNRYIAHVFATCAEMIYKLTSNLPFGEKVYLTMHNFFSKKEIEYFLDKFTKETNHIIISDASL